MTTFMPAYLIVYDLFYIYRDLLLLRRKNKISVKCLVNSLFKLSKTYLWKSLKGFFSNGANGTLALLIKIYINL